MKRPPWKDNPEDAISECFMVSFDIGENFDIPTCVVFKQSSNGPHIVNMFTEDDAIALYETLSGEDLN